MKSRTQGQQLKPEPQKNTYCSKFLKHTLGKCIAQLGGQGRSKNLGRHEGETSGPPDPGAVGYDRGILFR